MAVTITIHGKEASEVLDIVDQIRSQGYRQYVDFNFAYVPTQYDPVNGHHISNKYVAFTLYSEELATWIALKWT